MIATEHNFDNFSTVLDHLDEFGLTSVQFRVYCHLFKAAVDGVISESSESIAQVCRLTRVTVIRVLSQLVQMNLIQCDRYIGKKSVFHLMPYSDWRRPVSEQKKPIAKQQSKVVPFRVSDTNKPNSDTCKASLPVNEINTQQEVEEPFRGSSTLPAQQPVNEINPSNSDTGSLDEKLAAARERGWWDAGTWWNELGIQMVTVNRFVVLVTEFMQRSLDSFDVGRQLCAEGLRMCREQIEKIKQKKSQQLGDRVVALA
jgi:hypothetical protein